MADSGPTFATIKTLPGIWKESDHQSIRFFGLVFVVFFFSDHTFDGDWRSVKERNTRDRALIPTQSIDPFDEKVFGQRIYI